MAAEPDGRLAAVVVPIVLHRGDEGHNQPGYRQTLALTAPVDEMLTIMDAFK